MRIKVLTTDKRHVDLNTCPYEDVDQIDSYICGFCICFQEVNQADKGDDRDTAVQKILSTET